MRKMINMIEENFNIGNSLFISWKFRTISTNNYDRKKAQNIFCVLLDKNIEDNLWV